MIPNNFFLSAKYMAKKIQNGVGALEYYVVNLLGLRIQWL